MASPPQGQGGGGGGGASGSDSITIDGVTDTLENWLLLG